MPTLPSPASPSSKFTLASLSLPLSIIWIASLAFQYGYHISSLNQNQDAITCNGGEGVKGLEERGENGSRKDLDLDGFSSTSLSTSSISLPSCIPMTPSTFGLLTSLYTLGGFFGSLCAGRLSIALAGSTTTRNGRKKKDMDNDEEGVNRKAPLVWSAVACLIGSGLVGVAGGEGLMGLGRFIIGLGCGVVTVLVPLFLSEIAPQRIRGSVGVLNQLSIVIGIFSAQAVSLPFSSHIVSSPEQPGGGKWRYVMLISCGISLIQIILAPFVMSGKKAGDDEGGKGKGRRKVVNGNGEVDGDEESVGGTTSTTSTSESSFSSTTLGGRGKVMIRDEEGDDVDEEAQVGMTREDADREPLLAAGSPSSPSLNSEERDHHQKPQKQLLVSELWKSQDVNVRKGLRIVLWTQLGQQISGINAVLYYSTNIMSSVLPVDNAKFISLGITFVNLIMTFPPIVLIDRVGRRRLYLLSIFCMATFSLILGISMSTRTFSTSSSTSVITTATKNEFSIMSASPAAITSSIAIIAFVASFSFGLGPVPFVILGEVVPGYATSSASSIGLALNWTANFLVGLLFHPLNNALKSSDGSGDGRVFFIFTAFGLIIFVAVWRVWR